MRNLLAGKVLAVALVFVVAVGLAFYGGMVYQNHIDQPLFSQYTPSSTGGGRAGGAGASFFGSFASGGSQTAAALAYATPPPSTGSTASSTATSNGGSQSGANGANGGSGSTAGGAGNGGASTGGAAGGSASASGGGSDVSGTLVSATGSALTLTDATGAKQTIATNSSTQYYQVKTVPASTLAVGQQVSLAMSFGGGQGGPSVDSVTIAPSGSLYGFVKAYPAVSGGGFGFSPTGKVTAVSNGTVTVTTSSGRAMPLTLSSSTTVYQLVPVSSLTAGQIVSVHEATTGGKTVAANVVESSIKGSAGSLTTAPARRFGGGGGGGGGYGGGGGGYGGGGGGQ
jgi:hypothetical protein